MKIYNQFAEWFRCSRHRRGTKKRPLRISGRLLDAARRPITTLLELGSGGGHDRDGRGVRYLEGRFAFDQAPSIVTVDLPATSCR